MLNFPWVSILSMSLTTFISFLSAALIYPPYKKTQDRLFFAFFLFFLGLGMMHFFLTFSSLFSGFNSQLAGIFYFIAHSFIFFTLAVFLHSLISLYFPKWGKIVLVLLLFLALFSSFAIFPFLPSPIATPFGITLWNVPPLTMKIVATYATLFFFMTIFLFLLSLFRAKERIYKLRFLLFILGFFIFLIAGPSHNFAKTTLQYFLADILTPLGSLIVLLGIFLPRLRKK
jgi:hypothetical protein